MLYPTGYTVGSEMLAILICNILSDKEKITLDLDLNLTTM